MGERIGYQYDDWFSLFVCKKGGLTIINYYQRQDSADVLFYGKIVLILITKTEMKKFTFLSVFAVLFTALSFMSCNSDSETYVAPTPAEASTMFAAIGTNHYGNLVYYSENKANTRDVTDTISVSCSVRAADSTAVLRNIPASLFAKYVTDTELSKALAECSETNVKVMLIPYELSSYSFVANPYDVTFENVNYKGGSHTVSFKFWANTNLAGLSSVTSGTSKETYFSISLTMAYMYLDGNQTTYLGYTINNTNVAYPQFLFYAKK